MRPLPPPPLPFVLHRRHVPAKKKRDAPNWAASTPEIAPTLADVTAGATSEDVDGVGELESDGVIDGVRDDVPERVEDSVFVDDGDCVRLGVTEGVPETVAVCDGDSVADAVGVGVSSGVSEFDEVRVRETDFVDVVVGVSVPDGVSEIVGVTAACAAAPSSIAQQRRRQNIAAL